MAHGLVLRMEDMLGFRRSEQVLNEQGTAYAEYNANPSTGNVNIPKLWTDAVEFPSNAKKTDYLTLLRKTLLFMFSSKWAMYTDKGDLLCAFKYHYSAFKNITKNFSEIYKAVLEIFKRDPWRNPFFLWNDLFDGTVTIYDKRVQDYFESEPEEIVLARVHALVLRKTGLRAPCVLLKHLFIYHSLIAKSFGIL
ncbi:hypothetical protein AVEN_79416-1 [Araneus ventricosus]|uniref:Uncharacterized protein n=1 Tax=Araneus ventricosus TaxID=182803 RepID=A0A4Y2RB15_ARAVE|nr:hypothetical protein AVEN_79416-1 [Araneus ventricosus]